MMFWISESKFFENFNLINMTNISFIIAIFSNDIIRQLFLIPRKIPRCSEPLCTRTTHVPMSESLQSQKSVHTMSKVSSVSVRCIKGLALFGLPCFVLLAGFGVSPEAGADIIDLRQGEDLGLVLHTAERRRKHHSGGKNWTHSRRPGSWVS